jgi:hypothetical protein
LTCDIVTIAPKIEPSVVFEIPNEPEELPASIAEKMTPKMRYFGKIDKLEDEEMKKNLRSLFEVGFTNFDINKALL